MSSRSSSMINIKTSPISTGTGTDDDINNGRNYPIMQVAVPPDPLLQKRLSSHKLREINAIRQSNPSSGCVDPVGVQQQHPQRTFPPLLLDMAVQTSVTALSLEEDAIVEDPAVQPQQEEEEEVPPLPTPTNTVSSNVDIEGLLRAARSTGPKEVLMRLAVQRHLLTFQLSAVRIQSIIRRFLSRCRVAKIRQHLAIFLIKTKEIAYQQLLEEVILSETMSLVMSVMKTQERYRLFQLAIAEVMKEQVETIIEEVLQEETVAVVVGCVKNAVDVIMSFKPVGDTTTEEDDGTSEWGKGYSREELLLRKNKNPLIQCLIRIIDEVITSKPLPTTVVTTATTTAKPPAIMEVPSVSDKVKPMVTVVEAPLSPGKSSKNLSASSVTTISSVTNVTNNSPTRLLENIRLTELRPIVIEAILEESEAYLLRLHSEYVYDEVIEHEVLWKMVREVLFDMLISEEDLLQTMPRSWWMMKEQVDEELKREQEREQQLRQEQDDEVDSDGEPIISTMRKPQPSSRSRASLHLLEEQQEHQRDLANALAKQIWKELHKENEDNREERRRSILSPRSISPRSPQSPRVSYSPRLSMLSTPLNQTKEIERDSQCEVRPISATRSLVANKCASSFVEDLLLSGSQTLLGRMRNVPSSKSTLSVGSVES